MTSAREGDGASTRLRSNSKSASEGLHARKASLGSMDVEERAGRSTAYPKAAPRKPLIEYCTNEWKSSTTWKSQQADGGLHNFEAGLTTWLSRCLAILKAPKIRRYFIFYMGLFAVCAWIWSSTIWPLWVENRALSYSLSVEGRAEAGGSYGSNLPLTFPKMIHIQDMDAKYLPKARTPRNPSLDNVSRLIFIGDIHGCLEELKTLLKRVQFNPDRDHLVTTGDIINRGPESPGTVDHLRNLGASCVRGNHEDRILLLAHSARSGLFHADKPSQNGIDQLDEESFSHADAADRALAASLSADQIAYLESCPVILRVGHLKQFAGELVVVHGGLVPGVELARQDPASVMSMRSIDLRSHMPSKKPAPNKDSVHWAKLWNKYQRSLPSEWTFFPSSDPEVQKQKEKHTTVIYGHDSVKGLQMTQYAKGLDTGCVRGGKLTALVLSDGGNLQTVQVRCKDRRKRRPMNVGVEDVLKDGKGARVDEEPE